MSEDNVLEKLQSAEQLQRRVTVTRTQVAKGSDNREEVTTVSEEVLVRPMVFSQWMKGLKSLKQILSNLPDIQLDVKDVSSIGTFIVFALAECQEEVMELACLSCNRPRTFFDSLELDDAITLFTAVFEVNKDFFTERILPMFTALAPAVSEPTTQTA